MRHVGTWMGQSIGGCPTTCLNRNCYFRRTSDYQGLSGWLAITSEDTFDGACIDRFSTLNI